MTSITVTTGQTCGDACWHAREDLCRCSCGGRNHGCLRTKDGEQPIRTRKVGGYAYKLAAVPVIDSDTCLAASFRPLHEQVRQIEMASIAKGEFKDSDFYQRTGKAGFPCLLKTANEGEVKRWPELAAWREFHPWRPLLLWVRSDFQEAVGVSKTLISVEDIRYENLKLKGGK